MTTTGAASPGPPASPRIKNAEATVTARFYDGAHHRLVYLGEEASPELWDNLWNANDEWISRMLRPSVGSRWLVRLTGRHLRPGDGLVLEGGCGSGQYVAALHRAGYRAIGIDSAPRTVAVLRRVAPEFDIRLGDVTRLPFDDGAIAGYWSVGLVEHDFSGYDSLATEMARVVRPGGFVFMSFPYMSPLRRLKARLGQYPPFSGDEPPAGFYQFALDPAKVTATMAQYGFRRLSLTAMAGIKGCKDEVPLLRGPLQRLYNYPGSSVVLRGLRWLLDPLLAAVGCGHSCVLVLQRR